MQTNKFPLELRTFETRLLFLLAIFSDKYSEIQTLASGVQYKLDANYLAYINKLKQGVLALENRDPIKILRDLNREQ